MTFCGTSHPLGVDNPKCKPVSLTGQSKDLIILPFRRTLKTRGLSQAGQNRAAWGPEGGTKGELTFYFSSRGRDFRHTQVGGGHDVVVGEAVPRARGREGLNRDRRPQPPREANGPCYT